jgi:hypothetical protein
MKNHSKEKIILFTIIDIENILSNWIAQLKGIDYFELGDDPEILKEVKTSIEDINERFHRLDTFFELSKVPLNKANLYFSALMDIQDTMKFIQTIQEKAFGSRQNTTECIDHMQSCIESVRQIGNYTECEITMFH